MVIHSSPECIRRVVRQSNSSIVLGSCDPLPQPYLDYLLDWWVRIKFTVTEWLLD
jgi:hypothetical protein